MASFRTLDQLDAKGKRVLLRADLNVPVRDGAITDRTRIERLCPTIKELSEKGAKVIVLSHFDRPKGKRVPEMSLRPLVEALSSALAGLGKATMPLPLVEGALADGRLVALDGPEETRRAYWLVAPRPQWRQKKVKALVGHLVG